MPDAEATRFAIALLNQIIQQPNELDDFRSYQQPQTRDILVCTPGNVDVACAKFGYPIYKQLRDRYAQELSGRLGVWRVYELAGRQCQGFLTSIFALMGFESPVPDLAIPQLLPTFTQNP